MAVFVLDKHQRPLMPCTEKRARLLLERGRARVHRLVPFTIRLVDRTVADCEVQPLAVKVDPGSKTTGVALVRVDAEGVTHVLQGFDLEHRGKRIGEALVQRAGRRRRRRGKLRYRPTRFDNRRKPEGWLPPSLRHRVNTTKALAERLRRLAPVASIDMELVRFDTRLMQDPTVSGVAYQQGTLQGYEVREYLLQHWVRKCAYCGAKDCPLEVEHVLARSRGGSDRVSNLAIACRPCNEAKSNRDVREFLVDRPEVLRRVLAHLKAPLRDAGMMNATRYALRDAFASTGLPVSCWSGGRTKWNRRRLEVPKTHANDAACVGEVTVVEGWQKPTLIIRCTGRGAYQRTRVDAHGFPRGKPLMRAKGVHGFRTGDLVRATIPPAKAGKAGPKNVGTWRGRIAVRATGTFALQVRGHEVVGPDGVRSTVNLAIDVHHRHCRLLQRADGYGYTPSPKQVVHGERSPGGAPPGPEGPGSRAGKT